MNFDKFKKVDSSNTRESASRAKSQTFEDLRFRMKDVPMEDGKIVKQGRFYINGSKFESWGLNGAMGLKQFTDPTSNETVLAVVSQADATLLKQKGEGKTKGRNFKSNRLEKALAALGVLDLNIVDANQYIKATVVAKNCTIDGLSCSLVLDLTKGEKKAKPVKEVVADAASQVAVTESANGTASAAPVAETAAAAPVKSDW